VQLPDHGHDPARAAAEQRLLSRRAGRAKARPARDAIEPAEGGQPVPLSCGQERFWLVNQLALGTAEAGAGNFAFWIRLRGRLDEPALRAAITELEARHEVLRTVVGQADGGLHQHVLAPAAAELAVEEPSGPDPAAAAWQRAEELAREEFDLAADKPIRWTLLRLGAEDQVLLIRIHHVAADGWSEAVLNTELSALYAAAALGSTAALPPLPIQYGDYARWQRDRLASGSFATELEELREALAGAPPVTDLPYHRRQLAEDAALGEVAQLPVPRELLTAAQEICQQRGMSLFMVLLACYAGMLHRYTGQDDLVVGAPVAGRGRPELAGLVGFFVNTVPIRLDLAGDPTLDELLDRTRNRSLAALAHQDVPIEVLVEELGLPREPGRHPLVQTMLQVHNTPTSEVEFPGLVVAERKQVFSGTSAVELTVSFLPGEDGLEALWEYRGDLFDRATIQRLHADLLRILARAGSDPATRLGQFELIDEPERQLLQAWSTGPAAQLPHGTVLDLVQAAAARAPQQPALVCGPETVSYADLDQRSNRLANHLIERGIGEESVVGLCLERGAELIVAILAVLKAGAGYLPLDPDYPPERRDYMVTDAGAQLVLSSGELMAGVDGVSTLRLDSDHARSAIAAAPATAPGRVLDPAGLAYVIYTSGSTGKPKGAAVDHRGLLNYISFAAACYPMGTGPGAVLHSSISFDLTVTSVFLPLTRGGRISVIAERQPLPALAEWLAEPDRPLGFLKLTPAHFRALLPQDADSSSSATATRTAEVASFVLGGEGLPAELVAPWQAAFPRALFFNEYGPTETVVGCAVQRYDAATMPAGMVPIGRPIQNTELHVLDAAGNRVHPGVVGELYVGGSGVCRGYLGRPGLTARMFVPDHLSGRAGARLYRTGDLARWDADGVLHFIGRADDQVKVRGHRVELGEIDAALRACAGVADVVTVLRREPEQLVSYYTGEADAGELTTLALLTRLRATLPAPLVPDVLHQLPSLPMTSGGKIDRARLPEPRSHQHLYCGDQHDDDRHSEDRHSEDRHGDDQHGDDRNGDDRNGDDGNGDNRHGGRRRQVSGHDLPAVGSRAEPRPGGYRRGLLRTGRPLHAGGRGGARGRPDLATAARPEPAAVDVQRPHRAGAGRPGDRADGTGTLPATGRRRPPAGTGDARRPTAGTGDVAGPARHLLPAAARTGRLRIPGTARPGAARRL
jgi:amino acid adenylation domain-containing protein